MIARTFRIERQIRSYTPNGTMTRRSASCVPGVWEWVGVSQFEGHSQDILLARGQGVRQCGVENVDRCGSVGRMRYWIRGWIPAESKLALGVTLISRHDQWSGLPTPAEQAKYRHPPFVIRTGDRGGPVDTVSIAEYLTRE